MNCNILRFHLFQQFRSKLLLQLHQTTMAQYWLPWSNENQFDFVSQW
jgi:hypothetical protein